MSVPASVVCEPSPSCCAGSAPFYGQGRVFENAETGFILDCPQGYSCTSGSYPVAITVKQGEITYIPPTNGGPLRATCCTGEVLVRFLPNGYTQAQFDAAAQSLVDALAVKLAGCKAQQYNSEHAQRPPPHCNIITASPLADGTAGNSYLEAIDQTGILSPTWSLLSGALPDGLSLSGAGFIIGTPTVPGDFSFVIRASNALASCSKAFTIHVAGCDVTDWCNGPGLGTSRLRVKNFNLADWQDVCTGGYFATWDGTFPISHTEFGNPCSLYAATLPGVIYNPPTGVYLVWSSTDGQWILHALLPAPSTGLVYIGFGPMTQASPVGAYAIGNGPSCGGPASFEIECYTPP